MSFLTKFKNSYFLSYILRIYGAIVSLPFALISREKVKPPKNVYHCEWIRYLSKKYNFENMKILEIGSRNVTGNNLRKYFNKAEYIGFDFHEGENVDVVGDAHYLSSYFENEKFDLIFSSSVFEHIMMPWIVAEEISKILKLGGNVFIETTFSFRSHERPWNFFQFSDLGLRILFNEYLGYEHLESGMSNPMMGFYNFRSKSSLRFLPITELYAHSGILCKKIKNVSDFTWEGKSLENLSKMSIYPKLKL